ncbi:hypothetical protein LT966_28790 [Streptomyces griseobrunneus]
MTMIPRLLHVLLGIVLLLGATGCAVDSPREHSQRLQKAAGNALSAQYSPLVPDDTQTLLDRCGKSADWWAALAAAMIFAYGEEKTRIPGRAGIAITDSDA